MKINNIKFYNSKKVKIIRQSSLSATVEFLEDFRPYVAGDQICVDKWELTNTIENK